jgi:CheY-like chemotaxis protein
MTDTAQTRPPLEIDGPAEPATSVNVRRFLVSYGVKEHNHASEIARIINVDRSQSYRRLKGDVAWSHTDLRAVAHHFGAQDDCLLPHDDLARVAHQGPEAVPAVIRVMHLPPTGLLVPGAELGPGDSSDLVAVRTGSGWEIHINGDEPFGARRHAIEALTVRSHPHLQVALLEDDTRAAEALVEAFRLLGIVATPFTDSASLRAAIAHRRFDAYVLDWLLGEGTAETIVEEIREHRAHIPIVVVTGALMADSEMEKSLLALSAQWNFSTLDKPVRPMNLANALKQLVTASRA